MKNDLEFKREEVLEKYVQVSENSIRLLQVKQSRPLKLVLFPLYLSLQNEF